MFLWDATDYEYAVRARARALRLPWWRVLWGWWR